MQDYMDYMIVTRKMSSVKQKCCDLLKLLYDYLKKDKDNAEVSHAGFVLGDYVYEYDSDGWHKSKYDSEDWDEEHLNGETDLTNDELEDAINDDNSWGKWNIPEKIWDAIQSPYLDIDESQSLINQCLTYGLEYHNCHGFARFCLEQVAPGIYYQNWKGPLLDFTLYE